MKYPKGTPVSDIERDLFAQSPALQVASQILGGLGRKPEVEPTLADRFMAATHTLPKDLNLTGRQTKLIEPALMRYRMAMREAHRFVLDDDFTRLATEVSSTLQPPKLLARLQYATLPYETTWIEFNLRLKVKTMRRMHGLDDIDYSDVADRLGFLLHRLNDQGDALCEVVAAFDDMTTPSMLAYFFSTREHVFTEADGKRHGCSPFNLKNEEMFTGLETEDPARFKRLQLISHKMSKGSLWGYGSSPIHGVVETTRDLDSLHVPDYLERHGDTAYSGIFMPYSRISYDRGPEKVRDMVAILEREVIEFTGMVRFVVTVLTMLNEMPVHTSVIKPQGLMRYGLTNRRQFLDYHHVTIRLPKTNPVRFVDRHFRQSARKRAHHVMSHWRNYVGDVTCATDDHEWTYDHDEGYRLCGRCMAFSRKIPNHVRGDPSLGWVRKDYIIKTTQP